MSSMTRTPADAAAHSGFACGPDPDAMFPPAESQVAGQPNAAEARALATCAGCGQLASCRAQALEADLPVGVAGGMTSADRRAARQVALGIPRVATPEPHEPHEAHAVPATSAAAGSARTPARAAGGSRGATLEPRVAALVAAHAPGADAARVRALALGQDPTPRTAAREEVALAALARLGEQQSVGSTARALQVDGNQVRRWRDRQQAGEPLVQGEGAGRNPYRHDPDTGKFAALSPVPSVPSVSAVPSPRTPTEPVTEPTELTAELAEPAEEEIGDEDDEPEPGEQVAAVLGAELDDVRRAHVDPVVVRGLVEGTGPVSASRWETALAAVVLFEAHQAMATVARWLGEPMSEVRAWRRRYDAGHPLIVGGPGVGLQRVPRPAHLTAVSVTPEVATCGPVVAERGAA